MAHAKINLYRMYDWIDRSLAMGDHLPDDAAIVERFGFTSTEQARTLLAELADAGKITIKGYGEDRVIALGRVRSTAPIAAKRPEPSVKRRETDEALDAGVAKLAAILARTRHPSVGPALSAAPVAAPNPPAPPPASEPEESTNMTDSVNISVHVRGDTCAAIREIAASETTSLGRVAARLIEAGLEARVAPAAPAHEDGSIPVASLSTVSVERLTDEIARRLANVATAAELDAAIARADAAERKWTDLREQLGALVSDR